MHDIAELSPWDRMLKRIVWEQLGEIGGMSVNMPQIFVVNGESK